MALCSRMFWPNTGSPWGTAHTVNGRTYHTSAGVFDAPNDDVPDLEEAGAVFLAQSGAVPMATVMTKGLAVEVQSAFAAIVKTAAPDPNRPMPVTLATASASDAGTQLVTVGGTITAGDNLTLVVTPSGGAGITVTYTLLSTDTLTTAAAGLAAAVNANTGLQTAGITAVAAGAVVTLEWGTGTVAPGITGSVASATVATESLTLAAEVGALRFGTSPAAVAGLEQVGEGWTVVDHTTPDAILDKTVGSVDTATGSVTLSDVLNGTVAAGDTITFTPPVGTTYVDAGVQGTVFFDGNNWRDMWTGALA